MDPTTLPTFQNLPAHLREPFLCAVRRNPLDWLLPPCTDDIYKSSEHCLMRLQAFALGQGFAVVTGKVNRCGTPRWQFRCIHHSARTQNHRGLEPEVLRNSDHKVLTNRKRNGHVQQKLDCQWMCLLSYKTISRRALTEKAYYLTVKRDDHTHEIHVNPFAYRIHLKQTTEFKQLTAKALNARIASVPYSVERRVLDRDDLGLTIDARTYYNLVRNTHGRKERDDTISGLLIALDLAGFRYRTRVEEFLDQSGAVINRKLLQIWFIHPAAILLAQRFCAGQLLVVDGTFNTNKLRLPLLTSIGITNTGKSFPIALSYCPGETAASYDFFFESLRSEVFNQGVSEPGVVLGDQAAGLISSIDVHDSMPNSQLQFCIWHAAEAMKTRWRKSGYTSAQIDGVGNELGLSDLTWQYLNSTTTHKLTINRQRLIDALKPAEVTYIQKNWIPKEERVIAVFTQGYPNLGATATQRAESYHPILRQTTNAQLPLEESIRRLIEKLNQVYQDLATDEDSSRTRAAGAVDMRFFKSLVGSVTIYAINKIRAEWNYVLRSIANQEVLGPCECEILRRYSLPCKHWLYQIAQTGASIPRSLLHPRWWLSGPVVRCGAWGDQSWSPQYTEEVEEQQEVALILSPKRNDVYRAVAEVLEQRERLAAEERSRYDDQILAAGERLKTAGIRHQELAALPIDQPDPIPRRTWRKKTSHGKANSRALTAAEVAEKDLRAQERQDKKLRPATPEYVQVEEEEEVRVPVTPPQEPLASTAPARLIQGEGRGKRKRKVTEAYTRARQAGLQSLGYSQKG